MLDKSSVHRIIGAGIMLVIAVSVLPIILDGEKPSDLGSFVQSPSKEPDISVIKIKPIQPLEPVKSRTTTKSDITSLSQKTPTVSVKKIPSVSNALEPKKSNNASSKETAKVQATTSSLPEKNSTVKPVRWAVQIASFKNRNNARVLVEKLQAKNYAAYSITTKTLYKVFVGPEIKKSRSETIKKEIKIAFKLEGFIVKYSGN